MNLLYTIAKTVEEKQNSAEGHPRMATVAEITLRKILNNARIKPFQVSYYCEKRDPEFDAKMHDVLVIYKQVEMQFDQNGKTRLFSILTKAVVISGIMSTPD